MALSLLDQTAKVRVRERTLYPRVSYLLKFRFSSKLTVRIRVRARLGSGLEMRLGSELQLGFRDKVLSGKMFWGNG